MSVLDRLERRLEAIVESLVSRTFKGPVHPIEIARAIGRMVDREAAEGGGDASPSSRIEVRLNPADWEALREIYPNLQDDLEGYLAERTPQGGTPPATVPRVEIGAAASVEPGVIEVTAGAASADTRVFQLGQSTAPAIDRGHTPALEVIAGSQQGTRFPLPADGAMVGRSRRCTIPINDPAVSREHLRISRNGDGYLLADLESTNGTYLNDQPVKLSVLRHGDQIRIGSTVLAFWVTGHE